MVSCWLQVTFSPFTFHFSANNSRFMTNNSLHTNRLINETSPYLLQHAHNPVDWYPWGDEAFEKAEKEHKMLFVSIGYSSCHWCHVMAHESFDDEAVAAYLNKHYVPVKVDREERPDIDAVYMEAVQMMSGQGGWPLNIWLTPEGLPVFGGTYFPPDDAFHRPGFMTVLKRVFEVFTQNKESVIRQTEQMVRMLKHDLYDHINGVDHLDRTIIDKAFLKYEQQYDNREGGFSTAPKFPMAMGLEFLLNYHVISRNGQALSMVLQTLRKMIKGGIHDQLGGGFHRYSTDNFWLVPHFEKMLYDNALLLSLLSDVCQVSDDPLFRQALDKTVGFLSRDMRHPDGGFYSALDADSDGVEGKFYVWSFRELSEYLSKQEMTLAARYFDIRPEGNWESKIIFRRKPSEADETDPAFSKLCQKLLVRRNQRVKPTTDTKIILSWNSLVLKGLSKAYKISGKREYKKLAVSLGDFLVSELSDNDRLYRIWINGHRKQTAFLDDYGLFAEALTYLFEITGDEQYLDKSLKLCDRIINSFYDDKKAGFFYTDGIPSHTPGRMRDTFDNAFPGATSAALAALQRAGHLAMNETYHKIIQESMQKLAVTAGQHALSFGYFLQVLCRLVSPAGEVVVTGTEHEREPFRKRWASEYRPFTFLITGTTFKQSKYPSLHGKVSIDHKPTAYVCEYFTCHKPCTSPDAFSELLSSGSTQ